MVIVKVQSTTHWFLFTYRKDRICSETPSLAPVIGLEPTTSRLTADCSTDWTTQEYRGNFWEELPNSLPSQVLNRPDETILNCKQDTFFAFLLYQLSYLPIGGKGWTRTNDQGFDRPSDKIAVCVSNSSGDKFLQNLTNCFLINKTRLFQSFWLSVKF